MKLDYKDDVDGECKVEKTKIKWIRYAAKRAGTWKEHDVVVAPPCRLDARIYEYGQDSRPLTSRIAPANAV